jgi:alkylation response protein AidB-like acyl-CoA dehydrogenase
MTHYRPPVSDFLFLLETFGYTDKIQSIPRFADFDLATVRDLLDTYAQFCVDVLQPLNEVGDAQGVQYEPVSHSVRTPEGFRDAYRQFCENGFNALAEDPHYGGTGAPYCVAALAEEMRLASNKSFSMCPGLTAGLIRALEAHGTQEQRDTLLPKLISGTWTGTMCLTEPQCGTDLGLMTTKAVPFGDHYKLTGTKIWITYGEHDMSENIIHLVLARLPDAPPGIKGISTFVVPKFLMNGERNPIFCGGTDHKMGIHASPTCVMNLEEAEGWLVGEPHRGMRSMFTMMNAARLEVGMEGVALAEAAYQSALAFARDRRQSRSLDQNKQDRSAKADNILVHPDVRRMLLNVKSTNEALRGLEVWIALGYDLMQHAQSDAERQKAEDMVALLTPVMKAYATDRGFLNVSDSLQVMGGAGYTQDWPVEQYLRDIRIAMIYEGTNHIQALDLVARKLPMEGGRLVRAFAGEVAQVVKSSAAVPELSGYAAQLKTEAERLSKTTMELMVKAQQDPELLGAVANHYLGQFAIVTLGTIWLLQLQAAMSRPETDPLRRSKFQLARFFFEQIWPDAEMYARKVAAGKGSMVDIDIELL